jgi:hypothetical protein
MDLDKATITEIKAFLFDIDQEIKRLQITANAAGKKLDEKIHVEKEEAANAKKQPANKK